MDVNGASFLLRTGPEGFEGPAGVAWDAAEGGLCLESRREAPALVEDAALAGALAATPPGAMDGFGGLGQVVDAEGGGVELRVVHHDRETGQLLPVRATLQGQAITGVAFDDKGFLTAAVDGGLRVRDSRTQGEPGQGWRALDVVRLTEDPSAQLQAWRVVPRPGGGAWVLDRAHGQLATWTGRVVRSPTPRDYVPGTFRPVVDDVEALRLSLPHTRGFGGDAPVALACSPGGRVAVLAWREGLEARVHLFDAEGRPAGAFALAGVRHPYALAWLDDERVATLVTHQGRPAAEALVYDADLGADPRLPVGEVHALRRHTGAAFLVGPDQRAWYPTATDPRRLIPLSLPERAVAGRVDARPMDAARAGTPWHRLFIEAVIPEGCGLCVELAASDDGAPPQDPADWHPHAFGAVPDLPERAPRAAWQREAAELPLHPGLLGLPRRPGRSGLFSVLIQRQGRRSSALRGRFLFARLRLHGTGRASPLVVALRAWTPRHSLVQRHLPELYHEDPVVVAADERGPATSADFLERFVALFEGLFTPIEDKVAASWQLTHPQLTPAEALPWLASWMGVALDPAMPEATCRRMIAAAPELSRWRGTRRGLEMALELVTEGGVSRGEVLVLEEWRLRRTWATILGVDLADEDDPLTGAVSVNSNSVVGDSLVLGDESRRDFLALFGEEATEGGGGVTRWWERWQDRADRRAVEQLFLRSAHKASVLVVEGTDEATLGLIRRVVEVEAPAHVAVDIKITNQRFIAGVSALVGVDTRPGVRPEPRGARLGHSRLGGGDRVRRPPGLHPELEGDGG